MVDGIDVSDKIPEDLKTADMSTFGRYDACYLDDDWHEVVEAYSDGLEKADWIAQNKYWLKDITADEEIHKEIFAAIQKQDFRHGSCGGCI